MKNAAINVKIDPEIKAQAESILEGIGLSTSAAVGMLFRQIIYHKGLPFDAKLPNEETLAAIEDARKGRVKTASCADDLINHLRARADAAKNDPAHNKV